MLWNARNVTGQSLARIQPEVSQSCPVRGFVLIICLSQGLPKIQRTPKCLGSGATESLAASMTAQPVSWPDVVSSHLSIFFPFQASSLTSVRAMCLGRTLRL